MLGLLFFGARRHLNFVQFLIFCIDNDFALVIDVFFTSFVYVDALFSVLRQWLAIFGRNCSFNKSLRWLKFRGIVRGLPWMTWSFLISVILQLLLLQLLLMCRTLIQSTQHNSQLVLRKLLKHLLLFLHELFVLIQSCLMDDLNIRVTCTTVAWLSLICLIRMMLCRKVSARCVRVLLVLLFNAFTITTLVLVIFTLLLKLSIRLWKYVGGNLLLSFVQEILWWWTFRTVSSWSSSLRKSVWLWHLSTASWIPVVLVSEIVTRSLFLHSLINDLLILLILALNICW